MRRLVLALTMVCGAAMAEDVGSGRYATFATLDGAVVLQYSFHTKEECRSYVVKYRPTDTARRITCGDVKIEDALPHTIYILAQTSDIIPVYEARYKEKADCTRMADSLAAAEKLGTVSLGVSCD